MVARHEDRPKSKFFIDNLFEDFIPLAGDRYYGEDKAVITGFAKFNGQSVLVIGQEKGENLESRIERNFGMMRPEGYRKCIRLMKLADRFQIPVVSFIDTPGAYPGLGAEERGQASAIANSIECCMSLTVPNISNRGCEELTTSFFISGDNSKTVTGILISLLKPGCSTFMFI